MMAVLHQFYEGSDKYELQTRRIASRVAENA